jgi:hypothetical protein
MYVTSRGVTPKLRKGSLCRGVGLRAIDTEDDATQNRPAKM